MGEAARPSRLPTQLKYALGGSLLVASGMAWHVSLRLADKTAAHALAVMTVWTAMMPAMMLPSVLPAVLLFAAVAQSRTQFRFRPAPSAVFVAGYLAAWMLMGMGVVLFDTAAGGATSRWGDPIVGGALVLAGVYQLTHWKATCLSHCRAPLHFFMDHWRDGVPGALLMGVHHGLYCVGCCWGLMLALIALGMMVPVWMGLVALLIFIEKVAPGGGRLARAAGAALIVAGAGIAFGWIPFRHITGGM